MPNTKVVRSIKSTGMNKSYADGDIKEQPLPAGFNSTYPSNNVDSDYAEDAPINPNVGKIPSSIEPLGSVDLGFVSTGIASGK